MADIDTSTTSLNNQVYLVLIELQYSEKLWKDNTDQMCFKAVCVMFLCTSHKDTVVYLVKPVIRKYTKKKK